MATRVARPPRIGRIPIRDFRPLQPEARWPAKAVVGEVVPFAATVFREGHGLLFVELVLTDPSGAETRHRMTELEPGLDRWGVEVRIDTAGSWRYQVHAASDDWASWLHDADIKIPAGQDVELVLAMGAQLLGRPGGRLQVQARDALSDAKLTPAARLSVAHDPRLEAAIAADPIVSLDTVTPPLELRVERRAAGVGAWYEFFPRSEGAKRPKSGPRAGRWVSGTFRTAAKRLPAIAAMGFDVVYLPPIHPIGRTFRKGPNNSPEAGPDDPGSPWAIGAAEGGHDAIHPDLGTLADFQAFLKEAERTGLEVAIDLALQCSPDHPWVTEHPEWFTQRPDGTIAYAENPPKKYQDIYPLNFDRDPEGIRAEVRRIVELWIERGVRIFRVDNPHTKPLDFWEWLLGDIGDAHPDAVFLAEAFTRPPMLHALAGAGFQQSYSYFAWRNTRTELEEFLQEISGEDADYLRPNLFVNTPDILTEYLQFGGVPAYKIRAAIAATAAPLWGVYSGFELFEDVARPGSEENIDNEKYEYRPRDWAGAAASGRTLAPYLSMLNDVRRRHPALAQLRGLTVHRSDDDAVLVYSKHLDGRFTGSGAPDTVIVVANTDPHSVRETIVHLDLAALGLAPGERFGVHDEVSGADWIWSDTDYVRLDAFAEPVHILEVRR
ncbi:alpha-1,4-glucan--maltose-1-phosphate maltosyltransferase [Pseudolysinimonas kribbensis]|uniref:Alpha-1,4-glucan:maltose-1-phosphate maltosyltransferase n=1 Tax=Pseudolysinimonas kribbensis TaxID=433641 RepID=A0ABQ6K021_9MICO|nr:alpha-1,4-glucan:maltose-1-phosphate maltosyltransferase 2 [Pseudolysinimonas kribbensis]